MAQYIRLYLVPINGVQQVIDVDSSVLIRSNNQFVSPQVAASVDLIMAPVQTMLTPFADAATALMLTLTGYQNVRVCWREPVNSDDNPSNQIVTAPDPTGGQCVCGITCAGTQISYVPVLNVY